MSHVPTRDARSAAAVMAQAQGENFPVASRILPRQVRSDLLAVYGFARLVDDTGDEAAGDRMMLLSELEADLERVWAGAAAPRNPGAAAPRNPGAAAPQNSGAAAPRNPGAAAPRNPLIARLQKVVAARELPIEPFRRLIEANRRDQVQHRYETFEDLLGYCSLSANPVGELVLGVLGVATPERVRLSDAICSGLQLVEHWQDIGEDYDRGRIYLPARDRERFGVEEAELGSRSPTPAFRRLMQYEVQRTRRLLDHGAPLVGTLRGRAAFAIATFVAGGRSALAAIEAAGYDVLGSRPRPSRALSARELVFTLVRGAVR